MWLEWRDDRISFIHDYRYVRYVTADAELTLAPEANPADDGALSNVRRGIRGRRGISSGTSSLSLASGTRQIPNADALHRGPFCFDPAQHLDARCAGKVSPQFDLGERLGSDGRKFHLRVGRARAQRLGHPLSLDAFRSTVQNVSRTSGRR